MAQACWEELWMCITADGVRTIQSESMTLVQTHFTAAAVTTDALPGEPGSQFSKIGKMLYPCKRIVVCKAIYCTVN